jgi:monovalent cation:H+ antiporter-2, CPA2 family
MAEAADTTRLFIELGTAIVGLAVLARIANYLGFSAIPLYLLAGLAFGNGGLAPLSFSEGFVHEGADIGVLLLLFMLGLKYSGEELKQSLRSGMGAGLVDFLLNFPPGFVAGALMGWKPFPSVLLGGATYISSSGITAKVLSELKRVTNVETPLILSVLVIEDLAMAVYLPLVAALLGGGGPTRVTLSVAIAIAAVSGVLFVALRYGRQLSNLAAHQSDEIILLTVLGAVLVVAGTAQRFHVSAAIGAFLVGIAVSGPIAEQSHRLFAPLRDLFAATFFFFFGLQIDPATLLPVLPLAVALGLISAATKMLTGYWAGWKAGLDQRSRLRAGSALIARGEYSIIIAGLGSGLEPQFGPVAAAYVLLLAIAGPILARATK